MFMSKSVPGVDFALVSLTFERISQAVKDLHCFQTIRDVEGLTHSILKMFEFKYGLKNTSSFIDSRTHWFEKQENDNFSVAKQLEVLMDVSKMTSEYAVTGEGLRIKSMAYFFRLLSSQKDLKDIKEGDLLSYPTDGYILLGKEDIDQTFIIELEHFLVSEVDYKEVILNLTSKGTQKMFECSDVGNNWLQVTKA